ncbi:hypothetical protein [Tenacibaculum sp. MAR_2010_89]|nr:hypothetical protein [Tenacibaculum sp. MAR_2010_89]
MVLKIQSYRGKSIRFHELTKVELTDKSLIFYKKMKRWFLVPQL